MKVYDLPFLRTNFSFSLVDNESTIGAQSTESVNSAKDEKAKDNQSKDVNNPNANSKDESISATDNQNAPKKEEGVMDKLQRYENLARGFLVQILLTGAQNKIKEYEAPFYVPCKECYSHPARFISYKWLVSDPRVIAPNPIFAPHVDQVFKNLKKSLEDAVTKKTNLPHAIIYGPRGTGKSTGCEFVAKSGNWNYIILESSIFIKLLNDESRSGPFFQGLRDLILPTVLVIEEADSLLNLKSTELNSNQVSAARTAIQVLKDQIGIQNPKIMCLFVLQNPPSGIDPAFLNRITYQVVTEEPTLEELKLIIKHHATRFFDPPRLKKLTPEIIDSLAQKVFKGSTGRDVQNAFSCIRDIKEEEIDKEKMHHILENYLRLNRPERLA